MFKVNNKATKTTPPKVYEVLSSSNNFLKNLQTAILLDTPNYHPPTNL